MSGYTAAHCTKVLTSGITASNTTTILHVLTLLKELMPVFPKKELKVSIFNIIIKYKMKTQNINYFSF